MAKRAKSAKKAIEQYEHKGKKRMNNPPVGLVDSKTDAPEGKKTYAFDPHLDPQLQWAGKAERTSFEIPTVSLHVHERIDPRSILETVRKTNGSTSEQISLFSSPTENPPLREAIEFYKHAHNWSNRLIAGDSLLVMNSLLEKEGMAGQVQMVYFDPPYGIKYGSNFQPFVNRRKVEDGKDEDLTSEPEMLKAFRDTWDLGEHSYLSYIRDRLLLFRDLLRETGSIFVQISDVNLHRIRLVLDEIFGVENFVAVINFKTMMPLESGHIESVYDYLLWYARDSDKMKYRNLFIPKNVGEGSEFVFADTEDGRYRRLSDEELRDFEQSAKTLRIFKRSDLASSGYTASCTFPIEFEGASFTTKSGKSWRTTREGIERLKRANRLFILGEKLYFKMYLSDFGFTSLTNSWHDTIEFKRRIYAVQTTETVVQRALLMTSDPGDLVLDVTCGSGTTAYCAERWGRRWITCDTSRVAVMLAKQRLMASVFGYYELTRPEEGVGSGFRYKTVPHVTLECIANSENPPEETLYDQPVQDAGKARVTGPFTVEAVPAPMVRPPADFVAVEENAPIAADESVTRTGQTARQDEWRTELLRTGIRGKHGQMILFSRVEPLAGTRWLQADAETKPNEKGAVVARDAGAASEALRVVVSFGPEHAPLEQRQVEAAIGEARKLVPRPQIVVFAAFQFDPEAAKDIDELNWPGVTVLKAQMNADLLTEDLRKKRTSNESFWLIGQPDVLLRRHKRKPQEKSSATLWEVEVKGFDYYNTRTGQIDSGGPKQIAVWMLDTDYDGRSLFPRQVFFPMAGEKEGWSKLAKNLRAEIDEDLIEAYRGTVSLPFEPGKHKRVAVKIVDDRGIESLKILDLT